MDIYNAFPNSVIKVLVSESYFSVSELFFFGVRKLLSELYSVSELFSLSEI